MKTFFKFFSMLLLSLCLLPACSDNDNEDDPPITPEETKLKDIITGLEKIPDVATFTNILKGASTSLNIQEDKLTVLAVKNFNTQRNSVVDPTPYINLLKRHIIKGVQDFSTLTGESLQLKSIGDDELIVTKSDNQIFINGIPLINNTPTKAGESYIYVVNENIPEVKDIPKPKYKITLNVLECNESWSADNNHESTPSKDATVTFFEKEGEQYVLLKSLRTGEDGQAIFEHNYEGDLYYQAENRDFVPRYGGYLPVGVFLSEDEIASYAEYRTGTSMDIVVPGSIKVADLNGDGIINSDDQLTSDYIHVENEAEETIYITSNPHFVVEDLIKLEDLPKISDTLDETFLAFLYNGYETSNRLISGNVNFPSLHDLYQSQQIWENGYKYINLFMSLTDKLESPGYPKYISEAWNKISGKHWMQFAHIYSVLVYNFGDVVLITEKIHDLSAAMNLSRQPKTDVMLFVESLTDKVPQPEAVKSIMARYYANERNYDKAYQYAKEIIESGKYSLVSENSFATPSNSDVIFGGYKKSAGMTFTKGEYMHPLRYREVILTAMESALEKGMLQEAVTYLNLINSANQQPPYAGEMNQSSIRSAVRELWKQEMSGEGLDYMLLNRWNILLETLGEYGAESYNNLLPIPRSEVDSNPNIRQNPGY